jgi:hypothetical protein
MKYIHIRIGFYQSIRIGFGLAIGFMAFKMAFGMLLALLAMMFASPIPIPM